MICVIDAEVRRPRFDDIKQLNEFFRIVICDTFTKEGIGDMLDDMTNEIKIKEKYLAADLESKGDNRCFLIALAAGKIIGSIEYGPASDLIVECTGDSKEPIEVGTVFVHPDFQRMGVGNLLLNKMLVTLQNNGIVEFYLDSGYKIAQRIWMKKFGDPDFWLKDYWDKGYDHMIWKLRVSDWV